MAVVVAGLRFCAWDGARLRDHQDNGEHIGCVPLAMDETLRIINSATTCRTCGAVGAKDGDLEDAPGWGVFCRRCANAAYSAWVAACEAFHAET